MLDIVSGCRAFLTRKTQLVRRFRQTIQMTTEKKYSFEGFELDTAKRRLSKDGRPVALNGKAFDLLTVLVENCGRVVDKDELLASVWEGQFVEENNLTVHVSALRKIFGDQKGAHRFILTVPGKGYKFIAGEAPFDSAGQTALSEKTSRRGDEIIGRVDEIAEIIQALRSSDRCLVTLTGAGGSGKTRLAGAVFDHLRAEFPDGAFFIELAAINRAELVAGEIAQTLDVRETGGRGLVDGLKDYFRPRSALLVLDNFEQVISASSLVKELLDSASRLKILLTSRAPLGLGIEQELTVAPLAVPPPDPRVSAEELSGFAAAELFVLRAQMARASFALSDENAPVIAQICGRLDGLPLAIELAAVRVKLLSPQAILARLENSLGFLTGGAKDSPSRQRTMRGAIEWSYQLLDEEEKALFRRLAVFVGDFSVEAAEAIGSDEASAVEMQRLPEAKERRTSEILDILTSLVDKNLLVSKEQADGNTRLRMLGVVGEFASECLEQEGEAHTVRGVHAKFFLALAEVAEIHVVGEQSLEWLDRLETEHDNLRAALRWVLENEPEKAARMAAAMRQFWSNRSYLNEGRQWLEAALERNGATPSAAHFKLLNALSLMARNQGDHAAAGRFSQESLELSRAANDLPQIVLSCHAGAGLASREGDFATAGKLLEEALEISRKLNDEKQIAHSLGSLGDLFLGDGRASAARAPIEESLSISRRLGLKIIASVNLINLGTVDCYEGNPEAAREHFSESLAMSLETGNKINVSCCLDGFAAVAARLGDVAEAAYLAGAAGRLRELIGYEIELTDRLFRDDYLVNVRAALDEKAFAALYERGCAADSDETVALVAAGRLRLGSGNSDTADGTLFSDEMSEIVIEDHSFSRIIITEEADED